MAKATLSRNIDRYTVIGSSGQAGAPSLLIRDQNMPTGDVGWRSLTLRYDAEIGGTSTPTRVANGHIFFLNAVTVETDKHGKVVDAVDGLLLYTMLQYDFGTTGPATALTSTPADTDTPSCAWKIPFSLFKGIKPYDTNLDMLKARAKVSTQYGPQTNLWTQSGGSPVVKNLLQSIEGKMIPNLVEKDDPATGKVSELPIYVRSFEQTTVPITATATRFQIPLPFGDRIYRRIFITQRNLSTKIEMSNVIAATAEISLYINNIPVVDRRLFRDIQAENKYAYGLESIPTGVAVLDFDDDLQERIYDMLFALTVEAGNAYLYIDVTTQTNASLLLGFDCLKPIPPAALRG
jgi:hypothetical protein